MLLKHPPEWYLKPLGVVLKKIGVFAMVDALKAPKNFLSPLYSIERLSTGKAKNLWIS